MKVLITGAGGFIGSHLVASQLAKGNQVIAIDLNLDRLDHLRDNQLLDMWQGSIAASDRMVEFLADVAVVYHLASAHLDVTLPDAVYDDINVAATVRLARAALDQGVTRFVHCSSVGVMGDITNPPADEQTPCRPTNVYGRSKLAGERAIMALAAEQNAPIVVVRPAWVYGPGCPRTERLFRLIKKGRFPIFGSGQNRRHPIYVADLVTGLELAGSVSDIEGELFILAGNQSVELKILLQAIARANDVNPPAFHLPMFLGSGAGYFFQFVYRLLGKSPPISPRSLDFYRENNAYDIDKAKRLLGFAPVYSLQAGMAVTGANLNGARRDSPPPELAK